MTEISIYKIVDINESIKNKKSKDVNEKISQEKKLLTQNSNNFVSLKTLKTSSLTSK